MENFFRSIGEFFLELTQSIVIVISILLIVYLFFAQPHQVNGLSMHPTFDNGDYLFTEKIDEPYISPDNQTLPGAFTSRGAIVLGSDEYFISGDNRLHSSDSRSWGPITPKEIVGKAFFRYWPLKSAGFLVSAHYAF